MKTKNRNKIDFQTYYFEKYIVKNFSINDINFSFILNNDLNPLFANICERSSKYIYA